MMINAAHSDTTIAKMLVGNKCDLANIREVSVEEGKALAEAEGLFFMETSALDSTNVKTAFEIVIKEIYNNVSRKILNSDSYKAELTVNRVSLNGDGTDEQKPTSRFKTEASLVVGGESLVPHRMFAMQCSSERLLKEIDGPTLDHTYLDGVYGRSRRLMA
ncbi:Ras-related protein RABA5e [Ananas comosus]|uniref:Ras-related protein RABA5e n=1 Tax=Ananas comosus TaxID=4615 RepID=A0A199W0M9_ANACO|nr:Ras-related protein RABA5e [Ananas comosus]